MKGCKLRVDPIVRDKVFRAIEGRKGETVDFLKRLVQTRSVFGEEGPAQRFVQEKMEELGLDLDVFEADLGQIRNHPEYSPVDVSLEKGYEGRPNVVGRLPGRGGGRSLLVFAHIDTVPIGPRESWTHDPLGEIVDGRLYGRGASDHKSGIAEMVMATAGLLDAGVELGGDLTLMSTIEEEAGGAGGALACLLRGYRADAGIYMGANTIGLERITIASSGALYWKVKVPGKMAHGGNAHLGVNAIGKALKIYEALAELDRHRGLTVRNPLIEKGYIESGLPPRSTNLVTGIIRGGEWPSTVPAECELQCRINIPPGETRDGVQALIEEHISNVAKADPWLKEHPPVIEWFGWRGNPSQVDPNDPIVETAQNCIEGVTGKRPVLIGGSAGMDTRFFNLYADTPSIAIGCRGSRGHIAEEWVDLNDLIRATKILALIILEWCSYEP